MNDNFHDKDCGLRHGGKVCTCGYSEKSENEKLLKEIRQLDTHLQHVIQCLEIMLQARHLYVPKEGEKE